VIIRTTKYFYIVLLIAFLLFEGFSVCYAQKAQKVKAEENITIDKSKTKVEKVPQQKIDDFKNDNDFNYLFKEAKGFDFWSLFWRWVGEWLEKFFSNDGVAPYIRYGITFLIIAFIIYKIVGGNLSGIFSFNKKIKGENGFDYFEEDIHQENIDKKLKDAIREKNFRTAIRYYYLSLLKQLDASELIQWELGKTNRDYQHELKNRNILNDFVSLSGIYEYSWYGHFEVNEEKFVKWQEGFRNVFRRID